MNSEIKEVIGHLIIEIDKSAHTIFDIIEKNPNSIEHDKTLGQLLDIFSSALESYKNT